MEGPPFALHHHLTLPPTARLIGWLTEGHGRARFLSLISAPFCCCCAPPNPGVSQALCLEPTQGSANAPPIKNKIHQQRVLRMVMGLIFEDGQKSKCGNMSKNSRAKRDCFFLQHWQFFLGTTQCPGA